MSKGIWQNPALHVCGHPEQEANPLTILKWLKERPLLPDSILASFENTNDGMAAAFNKHRSHISQSLTRLGARGYVAFDMRHAVRSDGSNTRLRRVYYLTDAGKDVLNKLGF